MTVPIAASGVENLLFHAAEALRWPVLAAALLALAFVLADLGAFIVELLRRNGRESFEEVDTASVTARQALDAGDPDAAAAALLPVASSAQMAQALWLLLGQYGKPSAGDRMSKCLADFDLRSLKRLERSRMLVRFGPALGLMGTLIPLSPALAGLASGNVKQLSDNLRVAFSVTVLGLLIGAIAFTISLVRDRLYAQDLSDLEYVASTLAPEQ
jgi:biopolymer transport protein ExbB/TolQ